MHIRTQTEPSVLGHTETSPELMAQEAGTEGAALCQAAEEGRAQGSLVYSTAFPSAGKKLGISTYSPKYTNCWESAPGAQLLAGGRVGWRQSFSASAHPW